jgi:hypothetical protein
MENSFVYTNVRKSSRILFYICLAGIIVLFGLLALNWRYFYNFIRGPFSVEAAELAEITDPSTRTEYYVTVKADDVADTGFQRVTSYKDGHEEVEAKFPVVLVGQRILLIETKQTELAATYTGALKLINAEVKAEVLDNLTTQVPELADVFLPYMLVENNFRLNGIIGLSAGMLALIGLVAGCFIAIRRIGQPSLHTDLKYMERFGSTEETVSQIDEEIDATHTTIGNCHLTSNWVVLTQPGSVQTVRFEDIVWIYKEVIQNRTYGIPTHKTYSLNIFDRFGVQSTFTSSEAKIDEVLAALSERCPRAIIGHSDERELQWKEDRVNFIAEITNRPLPDLDEKTPEAQKPESPDSSSPS